MDIARKTVADQWREELERGGYEHHVRGVHDLRRLKTFSRTWRRVLSYLPRELRRRHGRSVFEFGCGGGNQLAPFFTNGWQCTGIDCSPEVLARARRYFHEIRTALGLSGDVTFICKDFLDYQPTVQHDVVFQFGSVEHFLDDTERETVVRKLFDLTKPNGYVVSIVPSGVQPFRQKFKKLGLAGYHIPEIDYSSEFMKRELERCGGKNVVVFGHNVCGYLLSDNKRGVSMLMNKLVYFVLQAIPSIMLPKALRDRHGMSLIGIAQK